MVVGEIVFRLIAVIIDDVVVCAVMLSKKNVCNS